MKSREQWIDNVMDEVRTYAIAYENGDEDDVKLRALLLEVPDPEGWKLVPFEPTDKMRYAGMDESPLCIKRMYDSKNGEPKYTGTLHGFSTEAVGDIFKAMIKASPEYKGE